jgi:hypothetical protein
MARGEAGVLGCFFSGEMIRRWLLAYRGLVVFRRQGERRASAVGRYWRGGNSARGEGGGLSGVSCLSPG